MLTQGCTRCHRGSLDSCRVVHFHMPQYVKCARGINIMQKCVVRCKPVHVVCAVYAVLKWCMPCRNPMPCSQCCTAGLHSLVE